MITKEHRTKSTDIVGELQDQDASMQNTLRSFAV